MYLLWTCPCALAVSFEWHSTSLSSKWLIFSISQLDICLSGMELCPLGRQCLNSLANHYLCPVSVVLPGHLFYALVNQIEKTLIKIYVHFIVKYIFFLPIKDKKLLPEVEFNSPLIVFVRVFFISLYIWSMILYIIYN